MWWDTYFSKHYYSSAFATAGRAKQEVEFILSQIKIPSESKILDMCCGFGRHALEFACQNYFTTGVDYSQELLKKAQEIAEKRAIRNVQFQRGDIRTFRSNTSFHLVTNLYGSLGYFDDDENDKAIEALCQAVATSGYLFLELYNPYQTIRSESSRIEKLPRGKQILIERHYDTASSRTIIKRTVQTKDEQETYSMEIKVYTLEEIVGKCEENMMTLVDVYGDYSGKPFTADSEGMLLLLVKQL